MTIVMVTKSKTTWTGSEGIITFVLPNRTTHQFNAYEFDRPNTTCELLDMLASLSSFERHAIVTMLGTLDRKGG